MCTQQASGHGRSPPSPEGPLGGSHAGPMARTPRSGAGRAGEVTWKVRPGGWGGALPPQGRARLPVPCARLAAKGVAFRVEDVQTKDKLKCFRVCLGTAVVGKVQNSDPWSVQRRRLGPGGMPVPAPADSWGLRQPWGEGSSGTLAPKWGGCPRDIGSDPGVPPLPTQTAAPDHRGAASGGRVGRGGHSGGRPHGQSVPPDSSWGPWGVHSGRETAEMGRSACKGGPRCRLG